MDLLQGFLAEAQDYVDILRKALVEDMPELPEVHRCWHTLAGAAEMLDIESLAVLARPAEEMVEAVMDNGERLSADQRAELVQTLDATQAAILDLRGQKPEPAAPKPPAPRRESTPPDFMAIFALEASEHHQAIATELVRLRENPANTSATSELRRVIHTFKGAAGAVGLGDLARLAHLMEDLLDRVLDHNRALDRDSLELLIDAADALAQPFESNQITPAADFLTSIETRFAAQLGDIYTPPVPTESEPEVPPAAENILRIPQAQMDRLVNRVGEIVINRAALEGHVHTLDFLLAELEHTTKRLQRVSLSLDAQIKTVSKDTQDPDFDPLELEQYSLLYQYTRELEEIASDSGNINGQLHLISDDFESAISRERRLTSDVQDGLMATRLVPFREIETRLQRIVHRTASDLGKEATFQLIGGDTKVDKTVLVTLTDPLMHLLRNAVDHGIETPQQRRAAGKPPAGQITLTVTRERSRVIIRLSDDGAGIDLEQVRAHAVERGLLSHDDPYDNDSLTSLLFTEGFSLSETVTQISGRGVGLDIARHAVRQLQGTIRVASSLGYGTTFTISVPITLAITSALFVRSEGQIFAVPLEQIAGVIRLEPEHHHEIEDQQVLRHNNRALMVYNLAAFVRDVVPCSVRNARYGLMIEQAEHGSVVLVDALQGTHDIVVKSLGTHLRRVHAVAGATVTGDGSVVLILDLLEVVGGKSAAEDVTPTSITSSGSRCVLVVDDSLSVRRVVCSFLDRSGWQTIAAKDGIEALERLGQTRPDVALVDIEMPRMNGYELLASMRADPALSQIPVIFLTSRAADKHRERASQLGAAGYLVKPYQEFELLAELNRVIKI